MARPPDAAVRVTVFASSTPQTSPAFTAASGEFGKLLATSGGIAVFGGGNAGCMGAFYEAVVAAGGRLHGITHRMFVQPGGSSLSEENAAELESLEIVEGVDLTLRKRRLLDSGDCLVALPGGVGTFDEIFMAIAELGVGCGELPICLLNTDGYYTGIVDQLKRADKEGMLRKRWSEYVTVVDTPEAALAWCSQQKTRVKPPKREEIMIILYQDGLRHGLIQGMVIGAVLALASQVLKPMLFSRRR